MKSSLMISLLSIFFILWTPQIMAASKMMYLDFSNIKGIEVDDLNNIRKSAMEIIVYSKKFDLFMAKTPKDKQFGNNSWYEIKFNLIKINEYESNMLLTLTEKPSGYLINKVEENKITNLKLQYRSRINMLKVLFGKNVNDETGELIREELVDLETYVNENGERVEIPEKVESTVSPIELSEDEAKSFDNEEEVNKKESIPVTPPVPEKPKASIKRPSRSFPVTISEFESPNLNLSKEAIKSEAKTRTIKKYQYSYSIGAQKEFVKSTNQFSTNEQLDLSVSLDRVVAEAGVKVSPENSDVNYTFGLMLSNNVGENEYGVSPKYLLNSSYNYELVEKYFSIGAYGEIEKNGYINIRNRGSGIESIDSTMMWIGAGIELNFNLFGRDFSTTGKMLKTFIANSNLGVDKKSVQMDGSKFEIIASTKIFKQVGLEFKYESANVTSMIMSKIETDHKIATLNLIYN